MDCKAIATAGVSSVPNDVDEEFLASTYRNTDIYDAFQQNLPECQWDDGKDNAQNLPHENEFLFRRRSPEALEITEDLTLKVCDVSQLPVTSLKGSLLA